MSDIGDGNRRRHGLVQQARVEINDVSCSRIEMGVIQRKGIIATARGLQSDRLSGRGSVVQRCQGMGHQLSSGSPIHQAHGCESQEG